jgi:hypothetical protein
MPVASQRLHLLVVLCLWVMAHARMSAAEQAPAAVAATVTSTAARPPRTRSQSSKIETCHKAFALPWRGYLAYVWAVLEQALSKKSATP